MLAAYTDCDSGGLFFLEKQEVFQFFPSMTQRRVRLVIQPSPSGARDQTAVRKW